MKKGLLILCVFLFAVCLGFFMNFGQSLLTCRFAPGQSYRYSFELQSRSLVDPQATVSKELSMSSAYQESSKYGYKGVLEWSLAEKLPGEHGGWDYQLLTKLIGVEASGDFSQQLLSELTKPFAVKVRSNCSVIQLGFTSDQSHASRDVIRHFFKSMDFVMSQPDLWGRWTLEQEDSVGEYLASYEFMELAGKVRKKRLEYTKFRPPVTDVLLKAVVEHSDTHFSLASDGGWYNMVDGRERLQINTSFNRIFSDIATHLSLRRMRSNYQNTKQKEISAFHWEPTNLQGYGYEQSSFSKANEKYFSRRSKQSSNQFISECVSMPLAKHQCF